MSKLTILPSSPTYINTRGLISLENFNPDDDTTSLINSPRSLEACRQQGIKAEDLIKMTREQLKAKFERENFQTANFFEKYYQHYEEKRLQKIAMLKKIRNGLIVSRDNSVEEVKSPISPSSKSNSPTSKFGRSALSTSLLKPGTMTMEERHQIILDKLTQVQTKEIQKVIGDHEKSEAKMKEIELKEQKSKEQQMKYEKEVEERIKQARERHLKNEKERLERERKAAEEEKKRQEKLLELERQKEEKEKLRREEKEKQRLLREKERQKKEQEVQAQLDEILKEKEQKQREKEALEEERKKKELEKQKKKEAEIKAREEERLKKEKEVQKQLESLEKREEEWKQSKLSAFEEKEKQQKQKAEQMELERQRQAEEAAKRLQETLKAAKDLEEEKKEKYRQRFEQEDIEDEERKKILEKQQTVKVEQMKKELIKKAEDAQKILEENASKEEAKKNSYLTKQEQEALKLAEKERQKKEAQEAKRKREMDKEQKIKDLVKRNEHLTSERNDRLMFKLSLTEEKIIAIQQKQKEEINQKKSEHKLKTQQLLQNIDRISRAQEYKSTKLLDKITKDHHRTSMLKKEQDEIVDLHLRVRQEVARRKEQILSAYFQKQRKVKSFASTGELDDTKQSDFFATSLSPLNINTVVSIR